MSVDGKAGGHVRAGHLLEALHTREAAAFVSHERVNRLALQVILLEEGEHGHGHLAPPHRVADVNFVEFFGVHVHRLDGRARVLRKFLLGHVDAVVVALGVFLRGFHVQKRAARLFRNHLGNNFCIALGNVPDGVVFVGTGIINDEDFLFCCHRDS